MGTNLEILIKKRSFLARLLMPRIGAPNESDVSSKERDNFLQDFIQSFCSSIRTTFRSLLGIIKSVLSSELNSPNATDRMV